MASVPLIVVSGRHLRDAPGLEEGLFAAVLRKLADRDLIARELRRHLGLEGDR
jgi:hypothetical protein